MIKQLILFLNIWASRFLQTISTCWEPINHILIWTSFNSGTLNLHSIGKFKLHSIQVVCPLNISKIFTNIFKWRLSNIKLLGKRKLRNHETPKSLITRLSWRNSPWRKLRLKNGAKRHHFMWHCKKAEKSLDMSFFWETVPENSRLKPHCDLIVAQELMVLNNLVSGTRNFD